MKKKAIRLFIFISVLAAACKTQQQTAKTKVPFQPYEVSYSNNKKVLRGLITRADIVNDTAFGWFNKNYKLGKPNATAVAAFKKHAAGFQMVIFGGTWCSDTQNLLPQLYQVVDASGYAEKNISLIAVDRDKTTLDDLNNAFHITNVPTFIVMKNGKEAGRVIEYGESGEAMKELGNIVDSL